eukprot:7965419-Karenia_brevis.AAC.1
MRKLPVLLWSRSPSAHTAEAIEGPGAVPMKETALVLLPNFHHRKSADLSESYCKLNCVSIETYTAENRPFGMDPDLNLCPVMMIGTSVAHAFSGLRCGS